MSHQDQVSWLGLQVPRQLGREGLGYGEEGAHAERGEEGRAWWPADETIDGAESGPKSRRTQAGLLTTFFCISRLIGRSGHEARLIIICRRVSYLVGGRPGAFGYDGC